MQESPRPSQDPLLPTITAAFAISAAVCLIALWAAGPTLGVLFSGFAIIAIALPPLAAHARQPFAWLGSAIASAIGAWLVWAWTAWHFGGDGDLTFASLTLLSFALACAGMSALFTRLRCPPTTSGLITILALTWLTWPIWLAHNLPESNGQQISDALVVAHPLLTMNERLLDRGVWTERPITYRATSLGQDLAYSPPSAPWIFSLICVALALPAIIADAMRRQRPVAH
jgi:hypothetical protein